MNTKHKIGAFTLSEMIIVIIITSIIVGMAFSVLTLVQRHMSSIQNNFNKSTELVKLEQSLKIDFNRYSKIAYNEIEDKLIFTSEIDAVVYKFTNDYIIKDLDTFNLSLQHKTVFFDGDKKQSGFIDAIRLETTKALQNQQLFIFKQNDAAQYMN
ncbi:prepilin-type N-terminal cleavage/methylation domain-containing protein [Flavivirga abyssicola]|uniref:prepilin-type N-terminal cleavage/methylation domain-containing protein n=1 Tax=Flavivirga abyssicola TaxID=3063533 RepID=UPI0026DEEFFA|nr:prepilin-type N-terminal cleavage/methylation domain-containing protein [Flavivirga sp. MEBiC07777]WVK14933.1 prepilin-type N-terminal cleavage/methylation domain-containing protein [Flavivirga sp. MEBiC07777]